MVFLPSAAAAAMLARSNSPRPRSDFDRPGLAVGGFAATGAATTPEMSSANRGTIHRLGVPNQTDTLVIQSPLTTNGGPPPGPPQILHWVLVAKRIVYAP